MKDKKNKAKECKTLEHDFKHLKRFGRADLRCPKCGKNVMLLLVYAQQAGIDLTEKTSTVSKDNGRGVDTLNYNIYRDIDERLDKIQDIKGLSEEVIGEIGVVRNMLEDLTFEVAKQIDKTNREWEKGIQVIEKWLFVSEEERGYKRWSERGDVELAKMIINLLKHKEIK